MKRYSRPIFSAETEVDPVAELVDILETDFEFFLDAFNRLQRDGGPSADAAFEIASQLNDQLQIAIAQISEESKGDYTNA